MGVAQNKSLEGYFRSWILSRLVEALISPYRNKELVRRKLCPSAVNLLDHVDRIPVLVIRIARTLLPFLFSSTFSYEIADFKLPHLDSMGVDF